MTVQTGRQNKEQVFKSLKKLVNDYLAKSPMPAIGPRQIYIKSAILFSTWTAGYAGLLTIGPKYPIFAIAILILLLILSCGLEFCIMHDASHQAFSTHKWLNKIALNMTLAVLGGCSFSWHQEHVVKHHGHTNVLGADPDVYASHVLRLHPEDKWHWWHRWQPYYAIPLYAFMWIHWMFLDLTNAASNSYKLTARKNLTFWLLIGVGLVPHAALGLFFPYLAFKDIWVVGIGYASFFMCMSIVMAMTFVLAHVSEGQSFFSSDRDIHQDWALHQLETTTDFAVNNQALVWILGGLNFQVEHHIFPGLCHLHYPHIQKIVKKYCLENGIPYHEQKTLSNAVGQHLKHLSKLAQNPCSNPVSSQAYPL